MYVLNDALDSVGVVCDVKKNGRLGAEQLEPCVESRQRRHFLDTSCDGFFSDVKTSAARDYDRTDSAPKIS